MASRRQNQNATGREPTGPPLMRTLEHNEDLLRSLVKIVGGDADAAWVQANTPEIKDALKAQTDEAIKRGIFGAPSFTVGNELFWGNDRLEDAVAWAKKGM